MVTLYRRHLNDCKDKRPRGDRKWTKCGCPIWATGTLDRWVRESIGTVNWKKAEQQVAQAIVRGTWEAIPEGTTGSVPSAVGMSVEDVCQKFLNDATDGRHLSKETVKKYTLLLRRLKEFAALRSIDSFSAITTDHVRMFRETWKLSPRTAMKHLELLKSFFRFATENKWIPENVAKPVRAPKPKDTQAMPFTQEEMKRIYEACDMIDPSFGHHRYADGITRDELLTFILVLRYSGLRIGDTSLLDTDRVQDGRIFLYQQKTGQHVYAPLPPMLIERLSAIRLRHGKYFFVAGDSFDPEIVSEIWRNKIARVCKMAGIEKGNPHRFRHTFAVELLLAGTPLATVSMLLGHTSIKTTERHYSAWTRSRQQHLEAEVAKTWEGADILKRPANVIMFKKKG